MGGFKYSSLLSLSIAECYSSPLCSMLYALLSLYIVTMIQGRVSIVSFPSAPKTVKSAIQSYLLTLTANKCLYLLQMRADRSRSVYNLKVHPFLTISLMFGVSTSKHFKQFIMCQNAFALVPCSLVVGNAPSSYSLA
jgi:hypothetical protein